MQYKAIYKPCQHFFVKTAQLVQFDIEHSIKYSKYGFFTTFFRLFLLRKYDLSKIFLFCVVCVNLFLVFQ